MPKIEIDYTQIIIIKVILLENNEIKKMYQQSLHEEIITIGRMGSTIGIIFFPLFYLKDTYMTKYVYSTFIWRFIPFLSSIAFLILIKTKLKNNIKLLKNSYIFLLSTLLIMIFGIFYTNYNVLDGKFNSLLMAGLVTVMLGIHIFSTPITEYTIIFPISVSAFFTFFFLTKDISLFILSDLLNPIIIIILIWIISSRIEKHNFSEFKSKFLLELNERDLKNEIEYRKSIEMRLKEEIILEPLTGVYNRKAAEKIIPQKIKHSQLQLHKLALAYIDIDNLKIINDRDGHDAGDALLKKFAELSQLYLSPEDYIFRIGGDEFIILFINRYLTETHEILDKITKSCTTNHISFSYGVSIIKDKEKVDMETLIKDADIKMYNHKKIKKIKSKN